VITFENTMMVGRPPRDVFAFLADFENVPRWNYAIVETTKASPGPTGVGTRYRQVRQIPRRSQEGFEVTEFVAERRLAIRGRLGPFDSEVAYELEAEGSGTRLRHGQSAVGGPGAARRAATGRADPKRRRREPDSAQEPARVDGAVIILTTGVAERRSATKP